MNHAELKYWLYIHKNVVIDMFVILTINFIIPQLLPKIIVKFKKIIFYEVWFFTLFYKFCVSYEHVFFRNMLMRRPTGRKTKRNSVFLMLNYITISLNHNILLWYDYTMITPKL